MDYITIQRKTELICTPNFAAQKVEKHLITRLLATSAHIRLFNM